MSVRHLRSCIISALGRSFPEVPVISAEANADGPSFRVILLSAAYERKREERYMAVYRFGIRYEGSSVEETEMLTDDLQEALSIVEGDEVQYRSRNQLWTAEIQNEAPMFIAEYSMYVLRSGQQGQVLMGQFEEEGRLK